MQSGAAQPQGRAFGVSLKELAAAGSAPVVLQDCLRWLALRGLTTPRLFASGQPADKRKLLALRHLYDTGRRPLRSKSCRDKEPCLIANLLLLWLGSLPEPLFPAELVPALVASQQSDFFDDRVASVRTLLKRAEPFVVEALFPLFELLHHYWINQADRDSTLQELGRLLAPAVFGTPAEHGLPAEDAGLLSDTVEMLITEYRPLFTQPFNLRRYEADAARQAAAAAAQQAAQEAAHAAALAMGSPLLTPIRCRSLSVMQPEGAGAFADCCGTPLADSPYSQYIEGASSGGCSPAARPHAGCFADLQQHPVFGFGAAAAAAAAEEEHLEQRLSDLLDATVSGMLFDMPPTPAHAAVDVSAACGGATDGDQPMSPVAVLRAEATSDGGDSSDGSDWDAPMAGSGPFAWQRPATRSVATC